MSEPELMNKHDLVQEAYKLCNEISKLKQENKTLRISLQNLSYDPKAVTDIYEMNDKLNEDNARLREFLISNGYDVKQILLEVDK